jgi:hypothetical protein
LLGEIVEEAMQRGHCKQGSKFFSNYQEKCQSWIAADANKRRSVTTASRLEWRDIAWQAEAARMEFEKERCAYIEHVVTCKVCEWTMLAHSYLDTVEHYHPGQESQVAFAEIA